MTQNHMFPQKNTVSRINKESNLKLHEYNTGNLLSCVTLDIEHYAAAHFKLPSLTYL